MINILIIIKAREIDFVFYEMSSTHLILSIIIFLSSFKSMKNVCDKYNRTIDSIRQLVSDSRIHVLIDVTNSE